MALPEPELTVQPTLRPTVELTVALKASLETVSTAIWFHCSELRQPIVWANAAALRLWRSPSLDELTTRDFGDDTDVAHRFLTSHADEISKEEGMRHHWTIYPEGHATNIRMLLRAARDERGCVGVLTEAFPLSSEERDPAALRLQVVNVYSHTPVGMFDLSGGCLAENTASRQTYGPGRALRDRAVEPARMDALLDRARSSAKGERDELRMRTLDGERWHAVELHAGRDPHSGEPTVVATEISVDELRAVQEELREKNVALEEAMSELRAAQAHIVLQRQMATLGELVAGIAHELNTPLGAIVSSAGTCRSALDRLDSAPDSDASDSDASDSKRARLREMLRTNLALIQKAGDQVGDKVSALRRFARLDEADEQSVRLDLELSGAVELFRPRLGAGVELRLDLQELPEVLCRPRSLNQVFLGLLLNAAQAVGDAGCIRVACHLADGDIVITVADDGVGIASEDLERVFTPGFTNWKLKVGTGLGLSICFNVVGEHGGKIQVQSPGRGDGATFTIRLPAPSPGEERPPT